MLTYQLHDYTKLGNIYVVGLQNISSAFVFLYATI